MPGRFARALDRWHLRKVQDRWSGAAETAVGMDPFVLRSLRAEARTMRREIDRLLHVADHRLAVPGLAASLPRLPLGTDWAWRADAWRGPLAQPGGVSEGERLAVSDDLSLYNDCPLREVAIRQIRNRDQTDGAPFGLAVEIFGFRGSFLSLATRLPEAAIDGLKSRHLVRVDCVIDTDRPVRGFARLNVKHGPNVAQLVSDLGQSGREKTVEFDLAYAKLDDTRIERAWLDVIFNEAANVRIIFRDMVVSRRPRAEL